MKSFRFAIISFFILFGLLVLAGSSSVEASDYLGEFCWESAKGWLIRIALTHAGDGHYTVNGRVTENGHVQAGHGNAEIVGSEVIMHLTSSGFDDTGIWTCVGTAVLDPATLDGVLNSMGIYCDKITGDCEISWNGQQALTHISCP